MSLSRRWRPDQGLRRHLDLRTALIAGVCLVAGAAAWELVDLSLLHVASTPVHEAICAALVVMGGWALVRGRLSDAECTTALALMCLAMTVTACSYESMAVRWASAHGMTGMPMLSLFVLRWRWASAVGLVCWLGQVAIVESTRASEVELVICAAIYAISLPVFMGHTYVILLRAEASRAAAERDAEHDRLTGLLNRRGLERQAVAVAEQARRLGVHLGVFMVDVDHFKRVNDTYGHDHGDLVLRAIAAALRESTAPGHLAVRLGGEEMAVVGHFTDAEAASRYADGLRQRVQQLSPGGLPVTVSIGVATVPADEVPRAAETVFLDPLFRRADAALYTAKAGGRNLVVSAGLSADEGAAASVLAVTVSS